MTDLELVRSYIPMAEFIASVCGDSCEVVLHSVEDMGHSIVYISSPGLTGRNVGDGMINLALPTVFEQEADEIQYSSNIVSNHIVSGGTQVRTSMYYIRNRTKRIVGLLCVNQNLTELYSFRDKLNKLLNLPDDTSDNVRSMLPAISANDIVNTYIDDAISSIGCSNTSDLTKNQRQEVINILAKKNLFTLKGCVDIVAERLHISVPSAYRYIGNVE